MNIFVSGHRSMKLKILIREITEIYIKKLIDPKLYNKVHVNIILKNKMSNGMLGYCEYEGVYSSKKKFYIVIEKGYAIKNILHTLAHECTHLKQFVNKELNKNLINGNIRWKNKLYNEDKIDYLKLPWEIEAGKNEKKLFDYLMKKNKIKSNILREIL